MTGWGQLSIRIQATLDRLAWGFGDLRLALVERGIWPTGARVAISPDGACWSVTGARLRAKAVSSDGRHKAAGLLVPESSCLWGTVQLPEMPRSALDNAVEESLWRASPLPLDHIVAAWRAVPGAQGGWTIEWGICKRSVQEEQFLRHGLAADAPVYLARQGRAFAVRGNAWQKQRSQQRWTDGLAIGLWLLVFAALSTTALMPLVLKRQAVVQAVVHVSGLEPKAAPLRQQLDELRSQSLLAQELRQDMGADLPLASVLDRISEALPDDAWLDRMEINGSEIRISGLTANAAELVAHLGRQPGLAEARATVANVRDNAQNKERFTFEMRWRGEGAKP